MSPGESTRVGYVNRNLQENGGPLGLDGTDHNQVLYRIICGHCRHEYAANGSDIHLRKCPSCQGGRPSSDNWSP